MEQSLQAAIQLRKSFFRSAGVCNNHIQPGFELWEAGPHAFAEPPFDQVAFDGATYLFAYGKTNALLRVFDVKQGQILVGCLSPTAVNVAELTVSAQAMLLLQCDPSFKGFEKTT